MQIFEHVKCSFHIIVQKFLRMSEICCNFVPDFNYGYFATIMKVVDFDHF